MNWEQYQQNEIKFWQDIYATENPKGYKPWTEKDCVEFSNKTFQRFEVSPEEFSDRTIADVGCGPWGIVTGSSKFLDENTDSKNHLVIGIDPLIDFYLDTVKLLPDKENVKLIKSKGEDIPLEDESVDVIFSLNALDHVENYEVVLKEINRILKQNDVFYFAVHTLKPFIFHLNMIKIVKKSSASF